MAKADVSELSLGVGSSDSFPVSGLAIVFADDLML